MHVSVTAVGVDRPGIVAAVTRVLYEQRGNIEDSRMAILGGHFAMMLIVALPQGSDASALEQALGAPASRLDLLVSVRPVREAPAEHAEGAPYVVSVYGADRPGIVFRVSEALAGSRVNITDLATHVIGGEPPVYVMIMEVTLPAGTDAAALERDLKSLAADLGVDLSLHAAEADTL
ncbi:MAG: ACT domain-containing protein [Acidobacteria bacterium]|nr:ACT domain-containing protein [Acidobacteriota bacterium]